MICNKFGWNLPSGFGKLDGHEKSLQTEGQSDDGRQVIKKLTWALGLEELKPQKIIINRKFNDSEVEYRIYFTPV